MILRVIPYLLIALLLSPTNSYSASHSRADKAYSAAQRSHAALKKNRKVSEYRHNWLSVISKFEGFAERYPKDPRADNAIFMVGELYLELFRISNNGADTNAALEAYRLLARKYPKSPLADDALYRSGRIYLDHKKNSEAAYIEFDKVVRKYPRGEVFGKAQAAVRELSRNINAEEKGQRQAEAPAEEGGRGIYVREIKHWSNPDYTRVVIYSDSQVPFRETFLKNSDGDRPPRLFLDMSGAIMDSSILPIEINDGLLKMARAGQFDRDTVRVVLDIESIDTYKIFSLEDPFRIVIDVSGEKKDAVSVSAEKGGDAIEAIIAEKGAGNQKQVAAVNPVPPKRPTLAQQLGLGISKIVVDPGHGGKDPGARGYNGLMEKDVVLEVGLRLREVLVERLGVEVVMTRDTDIFVPLEERTAIANTAGADLFISIHANASRNRKASGIETYFLNFATDEESMQIAAIENATTTKKISDLQTILNDLMLNSKVNESSKLARYVQGSLLDLLEGSGRNRKDRGVKQAPFYVLIGAQMPSILVETSFITNKDDAKRLADEVFQKSMANAIASGIEKYSSVVKVASSGRPSQVSQ